MSAQLTLASAIARRDTILAQLEHTSGATFSDQAATFIVAFLQRHGPTSGEALTDACVAAGIVPATSTKAFGTVLRKLSRSGRIAKHGWTNRAKGHATAGAILWKSAVVR